MTFAAIDDAVVRQLIGDGTHFTESARRLKVGQRALARYEKRKGVKFIRHRGPIMAPKKEREIVRLLFEDDVSDETICKTMKTNNETLAAIRARQRVEVPKWVPPDFRPLYLDWSSIRDETFAAAWVRDNPEYKRHKAQRQGDRHAG